MCVLKIFTLQVESAIITQDSLFQIQWLSSQSVLCKAEKESPFNSQLTHLVPPIPPMPNWIICPRLLMSYVSSDKFSVHNVK